MSYHKILVAVDFSGMAGTVLAHAGEEARLHQAELTLLHILDTQIMDLQLPEELLPSSLEMMQRLRSLAQERLDALQKSTVVPSHGVLLEKAGGIGRNICEYAAEGTHDLIVIGSQEQGAIGRLLLGSVASAVVHHAHCPVLVVKAPAAA
ncbi:universal stress protein [Acidithiobacillus sp. CV18-2]|uniref:Universal stress protein n=1 Tax=Igneacidithiobacillus copahuensis TaxID=2724909 RepID=A0AAE2YRC8_9PROT|nr:universal stress protein [Igneacidithiobacillus copahuensis]MBU2753295.1 universal stress protein [Acidithiobacillus sp. CV18-3]MBU2756325.1 universal stress protein [Acidithiobacillus sp. BN09-2]MBU2776112.1 universal stress protein [Acidithiobacillus sp. CV18-2]MBU2795725.1 universal stress protein [Acidithiobacillus sp. VAN18-2]MBU2798719.1 universal stress protein [Acidithiobacillus sp. VAN18-4]UTV81619.1 universal stress protein [Acidithiobacillus sp. YTS05]